MYRDDQAAAVARADSATRENDQLKRENDAMRAALVHQPQVPPTFMMLQSAAVYPNLETRLLPLPERARLANHSLSSFPVAASVILNFITFGIFGFFHFNLKHGDLPAAAANDPSGGKALGFHFIPYFNMFYWKFFAYRRLCDRLNLQLRLRGLPDHAPKGLMTAIAILNLIPYLGWAVNILFMYPIAAGRLQATINRAAALPPHQFDLTMLPGAEQAYGAPMSAYGVPMTPYGLAAPPPPNWR